MKPRFSLNSLYLVVLGDEKTIVGPGFTMFVPPKINHGVENTGDDDLVFIVATSPPNDVPRN